MKKLMARRLRKVVMVVMMMVVSVGGHAHDFQVGGMFYNITSAEGAEVEVTYEAAEDAGYTGAVVIPSSVTNGGVTYTVTAIGDSCFRFSTELTSVTIPGSIRRIGKDPFTGCAALSRINVDSDNTTFTSVAGVLYTAGSDTLKAFPAGKNTDGFAIPEGVRVIGTAAFAGCESIGAVTIPQSVTAIGAWAFAGCENLEEIAIPGSVTTIGEGAFAACSSVATITMGEGVESIGSWALFFCTSIEEVTLPATLTTVGRGAFAGCTSLITISVAAGSTTFTSKDGILYTADGTTLISCPGGKSMGRLAIADGVTAIEPYALYYCSGIIGLTIPEGVTTIGDHTLCYCTSLLAVTIPEGVTAIGDYSFENCSHLTTITLPTTMESIGYAAFYDCTALTDVICRSDTPPACIGGYFFSAETYTAATLHVPEGAAEAYATADGWENFITTAYMEAGIDQTTVEGMTFTIAGRTVNIRGAEGAAALYSIGGVMCAHTTTNNGSSTLTAPAPGVYILKVGTEVMKISIPR